MGLRLQFDLLVWCFIYIWISQEYLLAKVIIYLTITNSMFSIIQQYIILLFYILINLPPKIYFVNKIHWSMVILIVLLLRIMWQWSFLKLIVKLNVTWLILLRNIFYSHFLFHGHEHNVSSCPHEIWVLCSYSSPCNQFWKWWICCSVFLGNANRAISDQVLKYFRGSIIPFPLSWQTKFSLLWALCNFSFCLFWILLTVYIPEM